MNDRVKQLVAGLNRDNPPTSLTTAHDTLNELVGALRSSITEMMNEPQPDYTMMSDCVTAIEIIATAVTEVEKAEAAATAALKRIWKKLFTERNQHRVWCKLSP